MKRLISMAIIALWPISVSAQWQTKASIAGSTENNIFRNSIPEKDFVTEADLYLAHAWNLETWDAMMSYTGQYVNFSDHGDRNFLLNQANLVGQRNLEKNGWIRGGLRTGIRIDGDDYELYDYRDYAGFMDAKLPQGEHLTWFTGYSLNNRHYTVLEELDNLEHQLYGRVQMNLENGTTVTAATEIGYRQYLTLVDDVTKTTRYGYRGRNIITTVSTEKHASIGQWVNSLNISTPLIDDKTGLRSYIMHRVNFGDSNVSIPGLTTDHYSGNDLFDDRYSYESVEFGGMVSQILPYDLTARIGYDHAEKNYSETALDISGDPLAGNPRRNDRYQRLWARMEKTIALSGKTDRLNIYGEVQQIWNNSNDTYNDYTATTAMAGFVWLF